LTLILEPVDADLALAFPPRGGGDTDLDGDLPFLRGGGDAERMLLPPRGE